MRRSTRFLLLSVVLVLVSALSTGKVSALVTGTCVVHCEDGTTTFTFQNVTKTWCCTGGLDSCPPGPDVYATWTTDGAPVFYCALPFDAV